MTLTRLAKVGPWAIDHRPGTTGDLVIACASVGHDPTRPPSPEWVGTTRPHPALFLTDASRSWTTAPGLAEALHLAMANLAPRRILALGTSMGAFTALALSHLRPLTALIAIGPQNQPTAPWETRWTDWTARLPRGLTAPPPAAPAYVLHAGDDEAQRLPPSGAEALTFPSQTHSTLALHLKALMPGLIAAALDGDRRRALRLLIAAGGQRLKETP